MAGTLRRLRFRWVACQIDVLKDCLDYPKLQKALNTLPKTLDETYARILESIPDEYSAQAATILDLLIWSDYQFIIDELVDAIATNLDEDPAFDPKNRMPIPRDILRLCSSLVVVSPHRRFASVDNVQLAHFSVKEYLVSNHVSKTFQSLISETVARSYLARLCLTYLMGVSQLILRDSPVSGLDFKKISCEHPFFYYSIQSWMIHARDVENGDERLCETILDFFRGESSAFSVFQQMKHGFLRRKSTPLSYASSYGLNRTIKNLLERGADINAQDGEALQAAIGTRDNTTMQLLLDEGADVDAGDGRALMEAMCHVGDPYIPVYLEGDEDLYAESIQALETANHNRDTMIQLLLDRGADVSARNDEALFVASSRGYDTTVQLLLDKGANPNAGKQSDVTPLEACLDCGYVELAELLRGGYSRVTALESISLKRYPEIIRLLLGYGAETNFPGGEWVETLGVGGWSPQIVQQILERKTSGSLGANQLLCAMFDGGPQAEAITSVMLPYVTLEFADQMALLHYAAVCGSEAATQRGLDLGVNVHKQDDRKRIALHYAALYCHLGIVKMLVRAGSNVDALEDDYAEGFMEYAEKWVGPSSRHDIDQYLRPRKGRWVYDRLFCVSRTRASQVRLRSGRRSGMAVCRSYVRRRWETRPRIFRPPPGICTIYKDP
jgi:ankyrin repeat protein